MGLFQAGQGCGRCDLDRPGRGGGGGGQKPTQPPAIPGLLNPRPRSSHAAQPEGRGPMLYRSLISRRCLEKRPRPQGGRAPARRRPLHRDPHPPLGRDAKGTDHNPVTRCTVPVKARCATAPSQNEARTGLVAERPGPSQVLGLCEETLREPRRKQSRSRARRTRKRARGESVSCLLRGARGRGRTRDPMAEEEAQIAGSHPDRPRRGGGKGHRRLALFFGALRSTEG